MDFCNYLVSKNFLENIELPVFVKDVKGVYHFCNQAFADCFGIKRNEILGQTAYDIVPKDLADIYTARDQEFFSQILIDEKENACLNKRPSTATDGLFNKIAVYDNNRQIFGFLCVVNLSKMSMSAQASESLKTLTCREIEVFNELVRGSSAKSIARTLDISSHTVTDHLKSIYRKLNVHSKNEALYKGLHLLMSHPKYQLDLLEKNES